MATKLLLPKTWLKPVLRHLEMTHQVWLHRA